MRIHGIEAEFRVTVQALVALPMSRVGMKRTSNPMRQITGGSGMALGTTIDDLAVL